MRTLASLAAVALLAACPSTTVYRTADPVEPGRWRMGGGLGVGGMRDSEQESRIPTGSLELSARRGLRPDLDIGFKLFTVGAQVDATWRFSRGRWSYALAPSLAGARIQESPVMVDSIHLFAQTAAIASRPLSRRWSFATGPFVGWGLYWPETGGSAQGAWLGGFALFEARIWGCWRIAPELGLYRVVAGEVPVRGGAVTLGAGLIRDL